MNASIGNITNTPAAILPHSHLAYRMKFTIATGAVIARGRSKAATRS